LSNLTIKKFKIISLINTKSKITEMYCFSLRYFELNPPEISNGVIIINYIIARVIIIDQILIKLDYPSYNKK